VGEKERKSPGWEAILKQKRVELCLSGPIGYQKGGSYRLQSTADLYGEERAKKNKNKREGQKPPPRRRPGKGGRDFAWNREHAEDSRKREIYKVRVVGKRGKKKRGRSSPAPY